MLTKYNKWGEPTYCLSTKETEELEKNGFVLLDDDSRVVIKNDGYYMLFKIDEDYECLMLNSKEADKGEEEDA